MNRQVRWLDPDSPVSVYVGIALITIGCGLALLTWLQVANESSVALQLPYLASGGLTGVGLVVVGALVVSLAVKRRDAAQRTRQIEELSLLLAAIARNLGEDPRGTEAP